MNTKKFQLEILLKKVQLSTWSEKIEVIKALGHLNNGVETDIVFHDLEHDLGDLKNKKELSAEGQNLLKSISDLDSGILPESSNKYSFRTVH